MASLSSSSRGSGKQRGPEDDESAEDQDRKQEQEQDQDQELDCSSSPSELDSVSGEATDDEGSEGSDHRSDYSQCRSANFSSSRSWYHSPENDLMFGGSDFNAFFNDSGGSGDAFVDALDEYFDAEKDRDLISAPNYLHADDNVRGTGLYDEAEGSGLDEDLITKQDDEVLNKLISNRVHEAIDDDRDSHDLCNKKEEQDGNPSEDSPTVTSTACNGGLEVGTEGKQDVDTAMEVRSFESVFASCYNMLEEHKQVEVGLKAEINLASTLKVAEDQAVLETVKAEDRIVLEAVKPENRPVLEVVKPEDRPVLEAVKPEDRLVVVKPEGRPVLEVVKPEDRPVLEVVKPEDRLALEAVKPEQVLQPVEKKKCVMRLGSKEAEQLLQLDVEEIVRPIRICSKADEGIDWSREHLGPDELSRYVETLDVKETYMDTVWEMEEILLDGGDISGSRSFWANKGTASPSTKTAWGGASTSVYDGLWKVDSVEVIGARQRRGGASLGERVVGVREHTIYRIRVRSGGNEWEIERRYRDFVDLFQQMKRMFNSQTRVQLPSPWERVTAESRKFFGNTSPDVVEIRSALLQVCLQSTLQAGVPISTAAPLLRFLFPSPGETRLPMLTSTSQFSPAVSGDQNFFMQLKELGTPKSDASRSPERQDSLTPFGRTIRLNLQVQTRKPLKQQLSNQRNLCAGCYEQLTSTGNVVSGFAKSLGWGKPRFCEYTGQLFCSSCHLNETAILPARVLQSWDFTPKVVSQLAKAYLDSIYDQPMLCVSAVNPLLYSRVPILAHVSEMRRKLNQLVNCIHCPSRARIQQVLGSRRYLLEQNDFYALRDLADLSKGAFAVLPGLLQATLVKLSLHVTQKCSVCLELAEPCGAGVACASPSDLIYPYEDEGIHRCQLCNTPYHKKCFKMLETCKVCTRDSPMQREATASHQFTDCTENQSLSPSSHDSGFTSVPAAVEDSSNQILRPKRKLFSSLFGTAKNDKLQERRNSAILNMSAILGPIEL